MVRADNKQDSDRPHFYSQYWIDVALGKSGATPTAALDEDEMDLDDEDDLVFAAPKPEARPKPPKPVEKKPDTSRSTLTSLADLANIDQLMKNSAAMDDSMMPDITASISEAEPPSVTDIDFDLETQGEAAETPEAASASEGEDAFDYDEDEDEEGDDWGGSRRKKPGKPKRREHRDF